jgi:hypothetical protein
MGNPLFGIDISKLIKDNIGPGVNDATLHKVTGSTRTPGSLTGGKNSTTEDFPCKGFLDMVDRNRVDATLTEEGDVLIALLGDTINKGTTVPSPGDRVTLLGTEYNIVSVTVDPAQAVYNCVSRSE